MNTNNSLSIINKPNQSGAVLFVSLILLIVMTLLGITGMQTTILEEKMSGNLREKSISFQSAESAIKNAEQYINFTDIRFLFPAVAGTCTLGLCLPSAAGTPAVWSNWPASAVEYGSVRTTNALQLSNNRIMADTPEYIIEKINNLPAAAGKDDIVKGGGYGASSKMVYRITGRGYGSTGNIESKSQSLYVK